MTLTSAPLTFSADEIEQRGTDAPGSVIKLGRFIFYKSQDGFFMFNGESSEPIGAGKVDKTILADTKIVDRGKEVVELFANAGADWVTVMAGTSHNVIHATTTAAHNANVKVMLDLIASDSVGQSALEAKNIGADALLFHQPYSETESLVFLDKWDMIKGNSSLPIFVSAKINRDNVDKIVALRPDGIIVGLSITEAEDSAQEAQYFAELVSKL